MNIMIPHMKVKYDLNDLDILFLVDYCLLTIVREILDVGHYNVSFKETNMRKISIACNIIYLQRNNLTSLGHALGQHNMYVRR